MERRVRYSLEELQVKYSNGERKPLETLIRAFKGLQDKSKANPNDPNGFFVIGGYHGEPFHGAGTQNSNAGYWGGYCNHGNVLFPTWHRAYLLRLEEAMRSVPGCEDVAMAFWDEMQYFNGTPGEKGPDKVIPAILTDETFPLDGEIYQTLFHKGYVTVRFPYSGLVGTDQTKKFSAKWNDTFTPVEGLDALNWNVSTWLNEGAKVPDNPSDPTVAVPDTYSVGSRYQACLNAPNYMVFSNKSSAQQYMTDHDIDAKNHHVVSLEDPHNAIHLSVGGIYQVSQYRANPRGYEGANGDMGENNTAGLDPIFFFHHCFVDYTFWCWQRKNNLTKRGDLAKDWEWGYAGTNSSDGAGAPAFLAANIPIDMDTPLYPFKKANNSWYTSQDVTDISDLGYTYGYGALDPLVPHPGQSLHTPQQAPAQVLRVNGINRLKHEGSFVVRTTVTKDGKEYEVGRDPILSRFRVQGCRNCQNHLEVKSYVPVSQQLLTRLGTDLNKDNVKVHVQTHGQTDDARAATTAMADTSLTELYSVDIL